ncbi:uncharacterized protein LOC123705112 [Colias croceus]|uniref:uncharacterized protein LOC123705112 n=1 Tax=Colias crocea TaxID=72248 RepID=UPI001E279EDD|nr:uncharacterized protein LOC123705112 [Colias croceus]
MNLLSMAKNISRKLLRGKLLILLVITLHINSILCMSIWRRWWTPSTKTDFNFFRRHGSNDVNNQEPIVECKCPPNKECALDFKIDEKMLHFQHLQGILRDNDLRRFYEENVNEETNIVKNTQRIRRSNEGPEKCCCPPTIVKVPAFITEKRFKDVIERFNKM